MRDWGFHVRVIGVELAPLGIKDDNLLPHLHRLSQPTFFTRDQDFFQAGLRHATYCLAWLNVVEVRAAFFTRRFLRHPLFDSRAKRMGIVAWVHVEGVSFWRLGDRTLQSAE
ncbi:MAG: hypothetical protein O2960_18365 [Verrucomicrobia bacterium]|nr:hypothetical protein [Verrucomicrobiota bacterium]